MHANLVWLKKKYTGIIHQLRNMNRQDLKKFLTHSRKPIKYGVIAGIATLLLIPILTYIYFVKDMTSKENIINKKNEGVVLLDRDKEPFFTLFDARTKNPIPLEEIPQHTRHAFIAIEDKDFYNHPGFSISGIGRAIRENLLSESFAQGGSTISQQLIKNALLSPDKKLLRKYQELVLALELERRYTKDDILEMYLNTIYFGEGAFGIEDAAQKYFSKKASDLTVAESALLAGIIRAPSYYSPISGNMDEALNRKDIVLKLMQEQKMISENEEQDARAQEITLNPTEDDINEEAVHFALMVQEELIQEYGEQNVANSGFIVKTTLDRQLQIAAQQAVAQRVTILNGSGVSNGAAVAIEPETGHILALVGSYDWEDEENGRINMALSPRQPGSSFKPIIYAKALDEGLITPSTQLKDEPVSFGGYTPRNYDNDFRGDVLARYALANSLNIPAVHVMNMVGVEKGIEAAWNLGITTLSNDNNYGLPLVLGAAEVPLVEMTNAYATFANEGIWNEYSTFTQIRDKNGNRIMEKNPESERGIAQSVAFLIWSILSDNEAREDTFGESLTISRKAAVKTGTTEDNRDALTIGYTPQIAIGVWVGNNDNSPMSGIGGSVGAGPIWRQIMENYLQGKEVKDYRVPAGVVKEDVCYEDGLKVEFATSSAYSEFFLRGTQPTELCGIATPTPTPAEDENDDDEEEEEEDDEDENEDEPSPTPQPKPTNTPTPTPFSEDLLPPFSENDENIDRENE